MKKQMDKNYRQNNKEKINQYFKDKRKNDIQFKYAQDLRGKINRFNAYDCTKPFFKKWIEFQFEDDMNWDNYGTSNNLDKWWVFDHVIPIESFDLTKEEDRLKCNHWTNIQPIWYDKNGTKGCKVDKEIIQNHIQKIKLFNNNENLTKINHFENIYKENCY